MLKFNNNGITCIFLNLINLLFKIFTGSDFLSKWLTKEESIYYFISLRLFWSKKIWFIIKFVCHIYKCYEPYLLQLPILDFSMRHFEILLNVKCCTWYYRKCQKKLFGCYSNTFITNNESKCKDKFSYTPCYNLIPHINYL